MPNLALITTTVATARQAQRLATAMVTARLAACVQRLPIRSTYRWQGKLERADEHLLMIKTSATRTKALIAFIRQHHPYDLPEILVTPVSGGLPAYLAWVTKETKRRTI